MFELIGSLFDSIIMMAVGVYLFTTFKNKKMSKFYKNKWALIGSIFLVLVALSRSFIIVNNYSKNQTHNLKKIASIYVNGDFNKAIIQLKKYVKHDTQNKFAWNLLGNAYINVSNDSLAQLSYIKAISVDSTFPNPYDGLGLLSQRKGDYNTASKYYQKAISVDSNFTQAYSSLAAIEIFRFNDSLAVKWIEKAIELEPDKTDILENAIIAYHFNNQVAKRDSLLTLLEKIKYPNIEQIKKLISGEISIR